LHVRNQVPLPVRYEEILIEVGYRIDLLVEESVIIELKSIDDCVNSQSATTQLSEVK